MARIADNRMPKSILFSWLSEPRPRCGPEKRWRDAIRKDLTYIGVSEDRWYEEATRSRTGWKGLRNFKATEKPIILCVRCVEDGLQERVTRKD